MIKRIAVITTLLLAAAMLLAWLMNVTPAQAAIEDDLVACWDMDETSGTRYDSAGSNHLTDNNTVGYTTGKIGNAASFISDNTEKLDIADNNNVSSDGRSFTVSLWVNWQSVSNPGQTPILKSNEYKIAMTSGPPSTTYTLYGSSAGDLSLGSADANTWYFYVIGYDDLNNIVYQS
jgi:hypothetical protein